MEDTSDTSPDVVPAASPPGETPSEFTGTCEPTINAEVLAAAGTTD